MKKLAILMGLMMGVSTANAASWRLDRDVDPITDEVSYSTGVFLQDIQVLYFCSQSKELTFGISVREFVTSDDGRDLTFRIDKDRPFVIQSDKIKDLFYVRDFEDVGKLSGFFKKGNKAVIRYDTYRGRRTKTISLDGFNDAAIKVEANCRF